MSLLGRGGMGSVYVAEETRLGRRYALKVLRPELAEERAQVERFLREAQTIARLEHPNIVDIHSFGEDPSGFVFFTMELLAGEDLESRILARAERPYGVREACAWAIQIARAVGVVHHHGLIHRDLKTQNVFLARTRDGGEIVKLLDFGIARPEEGSELTRTGNVLGTPSYMSPEQVRNDRLDRRSDIYSFGVLLFKLLTGRPPFIGEAIQVALQHLSSPPPSASSFAPGVPPALDHLILKAMSKEPGDRHASMDEIERALAAVQTGEPAIAVASPAPSTPPLPPASTRHDALDVTAVRFAPVHAPPPAPEQEDSDQVTARSTVSPVATEPTLAPIPATPAPVDAPSMPRTPVWHLLALGASLAGLLALVVWLVTRPSPQAPVATAAAPTSPPTAPPPDASKTLQRALPAPVDESVAPEPTTPPALTPNPPADATGPSGPEDQRPPKSGPPRSESPKPNPGQVDPLAKIKERARACRKRHNAAGVPPITVEYAIGSDGAVMRASPSSDTPLGTCLAEAVRQARFEPRIRLRQEIAL